MSIFTPLDNFVKKEVKALTNFLESPLVKSIENDLDQALNFALPIAAEFATSGYIPSSVVTIMEKYAIPVADGLANGTITAIGEIKQLIGSGLSALIQKNHGLSGTLATIVNNIAYAHANPTVLTVSPVTVTVAAALPAPSAPAVVAAPATPTSAPAPKPAPATSTTPEATTPVAK